MIALNPLALSPKVLGWIGLALALVAGWLYVCYLQARNEHLTGLVQTYEVNYNRALDQLEREHKARDERDARLKQEKTQAKVFEEKLDAVCELNPDWADTRIDPELYARLCGRMPGQSSADPGL